MDVLDDTIFFKSIPAMYKKERSGEKPNTVRVIENDEIVQHVEDFHKINITNIHTNENFTRTLEDVSTSLIKGTRIFIFSWR
jgi:hypothetical protein